MLSWAEHPVPEQARRRSLGNIQFIGFLFKKKMLTEKIMHSCVVRLMSDVRALAQALPCSCVLATFCDAFCDAFCCDKRNGVPKGLKKCPLYVYCSNCYTTCCTPTTLDQSWQSITSLAQQATCPCQLEGCFGVGCCGAGALIIHTLSLSESHCVGLSAQVDNPKPEDVECLCKLLATIGQLLDASEIGQQVRRTS